MHKIGRCLDPLFAHIYGDLKLPKNDQDVLDNCKVFEDAEKCIRAIAKDCLTGIHKTATGAVSTGRCSTDPILCVLSSD